MSSTEPLKLDLPRMMTAREAADAIGVSVWTIKRWIYEGTLPAYRVGERRLMVLGVDVESMIQPVEVKP